MIKIKWWTEDYLLDEQDVINSNLNKRKGLTMDFEDALPEVKDLVHPNAIWATFQMNRAQRRKYKLS